MTDTAAKVRGIIATHLRIGRDRVVDEADLMADLGADSLDLVELVMTFEEEFSIEIPDDEAEKILTVGAAVKFVVSRVGA